MYAISLQSFSFHPLSSSNPHNKPKKNRPPLFISTNPSHLNVLHLRDLFFSTNLSCHRFPHLDSHGRVEPVDLHKLRTAVLHSSVVVSVFSRGEFCEGEGRDMETSEFGIGELIRRAVPVSESNGRLVGFGRAVSDCGLTASIYDVAVIPSLQGLGIGHLIVKRIIRVLTSGGIYDIAALCSEKERLFFEACGFKEDSLGSTTMMYMQAAPNCVKDDLLVKCSGRMMLLVPPMRKPVVLNEMIPIDEKGF
ncbi:hypothetical protein AAC387_Pa11g1007 [Persea americana]